MAQLKPDADDVMKVGHALHKRVARGQLARTDVANSSDYLVDVPTLAPKNMEVNPVNQGVTNVGQAEAEAEASNGSVFDMVGGPLNMAVMAAPALPLVAGGAGKAASWVGEKAGIKSLANAGNKTQAAVTEFNGKTIGGVLGGNKVSAKIGEVSEKVFGVLGKGLSNFTRVTGIDAAGAKYHGGLENRRNNKVQTLVKEYSGKHIYNLPPHLLVKADELIAHSNGNGGAINLEALQKSRTEFAEAVGEKALSSSERKAVNLVTKIGVKTGGVAESRAAGAAWKSSSSILTGFTKVVGTSKLFPGGVNLFLLVTSIMGIGAVVKGFVQNLSGVKEMASDIKGKKVSTASALLGDVPAPVAEARSKAVATSAVSLAAGVAGVAALISSTVKGKMGFLAFALPAGAAAVAEMMIGKSSAPDYKAFKKAYDSGQKMSADDYAMLLGKVSPQLQKSGAEAFSQKLAEQYAAIQAGPALIMREISNGGLDKRIKSIIAVNDAAKPVAGAAEVATATNSHVASLKGNAVDKKQPVLGNHTAKIVANAGLANGALTHSSV